MELAHQLEVINIKDLSVLELAPDKAYDIKEKGVIFRARNNPNFDKICQVLPTVVSVAYLHFDFDLDAADLLLLGKNIACNHSITTLIFKITRKIDREAFQHFSDSIKANNKTLKKIVFNLRDLRSLASINGLQIATRTFEVCYDDFGNFPLLVNVLKNTKIDTLAVEDGFGRQAVRTLLGIAEFFDHVVAQNSLRELRFGGTVTPLAFPYLARLVERTTSLRAIKLSSINAEELLAALVEALSKRNLKQVTLVVHKVLNVDNQHWLNLANVLRSMDKLTNVHIFGSSNMDSMSFIKVLGESESLRKILVTKSNDSDYSPFTECTNIALRNIKLQNSRVSSLITVLFNIARDNLRATFPYDVWLIIMSYISIPGVSLDFGPIARAIFKDPVTIRRVINKRVKTTPHTKLGNV